MPNHIHPFTHYHSKLMTLNNKSPAVTRESQLHCLHAVASKYEYSFLLTYNYINCNIA